MHARAVSVCTQRIEQEKCGDIERKQAQKRVHRGPTNYINGEARVERKEPVGKEHHPPKVSVSDT
jgi:hypothetical protein